MNSKRPSAQMIDLVELRRRRHKVAVPQGMSFASAGQGTGVARLFLVLFLIHAAVVAAIIVYDSMGQDASGSVALPLAPAPLTTLKREDSLPKPRLALSSLPPIEDCATYEWRSGDSIASVARKLGVTEDVIIEMNMLDKGVALEANSIIRYPRAPVEKASPFQPSQADNTKPANLVSPALADSAAPDSTAVTSPKLAEAERTQASGPAPTEPPVLAPTLEAQLAPTPMSVAFLPSTEARQMQPRKPALAPAVLKVGPQPAAFAVPDQAKSVMSLETAAATDEVPKALPVSPEESVPQALAVSPQELQVEVADEDQAPAASPPAARFHRVRRGDTLFAIARMHSLSLRELQAANPGVKPQSLREGLQLVLPSR